jgi:DNA repair exonuclease SbcCD ATPase subunit
MNKLIESIRLKNFRKHDDLLLEFDNDFNVIHGRNNAGKTTVFYGIEYCLFGAVQGFKKISQLASFDSKAIGVELIFTSKSGDKFKLQRMHKITGKNRTAKGFFTLKHILDDGEDYVLSSDFGDREENLSLKINELTGISRRFFETGVHFHQGSISEILEGSKKLDIVFGITAATTLSDIFRGRALEFEKEVGNIEKLRIMLDQTIKEKKEQSDKAKDQSKKIESLNMNIASKENQVNSLVKMKGFSEIISKSVETYQKCSDELEQFKLKTEILEKEFNEIKSKVGSKKDVNSKIKTNQDNLTKIKNQVKEQEEKIENLREKIKVEEKNKSGIENKINNLNEMNSELESLIKKVGEKQEIEKQHDEDIKNVKSCTKKIKDIESQIEGSQKLLRESSREMGDIEGILSRRKNSKDKPKCEYCGAPIDPKKIEQDISSLQKKMKILENNITDSEKEEKGLKNELIGIRDNEKKLNESIQLKKTAIEQITSLENKIQQTGLKLDLEKKLKAIDLKIRESETSITNEKQTLNDLTSEENNIDKENLTLKSQIEQFENLEKKLAENREAHQTTKDLLENDLDDLITRFSDIHDKLKEELKKQKTKFSEEELKNFSNSVEVVIKKFNISKDNFTIDKVSALRDEFRELILTKNSETSTQLNMLRDQLREIEQFASEVQNQILKLDKTIASLEKDINALKTKEKLRIKYREFQEVFNNMQNMIRENAAKALENRILILHRKLSVDDEFEKIIIDNENYSLSVIPKGLKSDEFYPATVYQGGGHKLILGLSYKIALGDLINTPPFLLVDEPTEFMDANNRINLLSNINSISDKSQLLLITHQDVDKIEANKKIEIQKATTGGIA